MNKKVLITGGAGSLGSEISALFAKNGYDVIVLYHNSQKEAEELCAKLESAFGITASFKRVDLEKENEIENLFDEIDELDVLVNNAAYNDDKDLFEKTSSDFEKAYKVNAIAPFLMAKLAYPKLKSRGGSIVNVASTNGIDTMYQESIDYDASKAALINITKSLSSAFCGVRVNAVAPGWINTKSTSDMEAGFKEDQESMITLKRFAYAKEIASVIYFLASPEASYMTGSIVRIDGGKRYGNK